MKNDKKEATIKLAVARVDSILASLDEFVSDVNQNVLWMSTKKHLSDAATDAWALVTHQDGKELSALGDRELMESIATLADSVEIVNQFTQECHDVDLMDYREMERQLIAVKKAWAARESI